MMRMPRPLSTEVVFAVLCAFVFGGCSDARTTLIAPGDAGLLAAKGPSVSVQATDPAYGNRGQVNKTVKITGAGFKDGASAVWLYKGAVDPTITVVSTQFVNSTTLIATISIDPDSPLDFRDVEVMNRDRTQGIGAALFEVTQAHIIPGAAPARDVNDDGEITGSLLNGGGTFYYNITSGLLQTVSTAPGTGYEISPLGNAIAGGGLNGIGAPYLYIRSGPVGTAWTATPLPVDAKANGGAADAMVTDPVTGQVTLLGGLETFAQSGNCAGSNAVIWSLQGSTWQRIVLPKNGVCQAAIRPRGLSANGTAVGMVGGSAAVWTPNGSGGYTLTLLDGNYANGINGDGSMIVGEKNVTRNTTTGVYWRASGGLWGHAVAFAGGCTSSRDVSDVSGRVTLNGCSFGSGNVTYAAYMDAPYTSATKLGGVGGHNNDLVTGISPSGRYMVGNGFTSGGVQVGVYWSVP